MTEPLRRSEEYPLINPDGKGDKPVFNQPPVMPMEWNLTCAPKRPSWFSRWPQFISACWMSVVFLTILFVIFYAFGSIYRLQSMVILKYNDSKPAGEVYYHYVVPRDNSVPFKTFTNYLSFMATKYPLLNFNVHLLIDDTPQGSFYFSPRSSMRFRRFIPNYSGPIGFVSMKNNDRDIEDIQRKHPNVNVSVLSLSKYMAKTPFLRKYRSIPVTFLPFYVRAYEVWKNGGIGLNLLTQNYRFNALKRIDFKLDAILKQHSQSVNLSKYTQALDNIDVQDEREIFAFLFDAFNEIPKMMFQTFYNFKGVSDNEDMHGLPMTYIKIKRSTISSNEIHKNTTPNDTNTNVSNIKTEHAKENDSEALNTTQIKDISSNIGINGIKLNDSGIAKENENPNNSPNHYQVYELSRFIDDIAAFYEIMDVENTRDFHNKNNDKNYLTLDSDGSIMAAYSRNHPFLFKLLYTPKILKYSPRYIICDTIRESCFRSMHSADYCDSIKVLNYL